MDRLKSLTKKQIPKKKGPNHWPHLIIITLLSTVNIYDYNDCDQEPDYMDRSTWEDMTIAQQIDHIDRAWEDKTGEIAPEDYDEGDYGNPAELDEAHERIYGGYPW